MKKNGKDSDVVPVGRLLTTGTVNMDLKGQTKLEIIDELLGMLDGAGFLTDRNAVRQAVIERERKLSTGLENGVAVPHGKSNGVNRLVAAFGINKKGLYFDSADGKPAHLFFMLVSPESVSGPHIRALASIAKFMNTAGNRERLLKAGGKEDILELFKEMT